MAHLRQFLARFAGCKVWRGRLKRPHDFRQDDTRSNPDGKIVGEPDFDNARTRPITGVFDRPQKLAQRGMDFF
jgi:hypothetical protein